ncbi:MAG TPA: hypothetical protein VL403_08410 [Candidatus Kryptonia bacterium]|nr:hypothetical protein [Candidatus Kryptonia bacterium]
MRDRPTTRKRSSEEGFTFVSILVAVLVLAALYFGYFHFTSVSGERKKGIESIQAAKDVACRTQRQQIERDVQMYAADHDNPARSLDDLERAGIHVPPCPEGGTYSLRGTHVLCSKHQ